MMTTLLKGDESLKAVECCECLMMVRGGGVCVAV